MIRIFLKLYLMVFAPILVLLLILTLLQINPLFWLFHGWLNELAEEQYRGTFYLLTHNLATVPQEQWPHRIQTLNEGFGRELRLIAIDSGDIDEATRHALLSTGHNYITKPFRQYIQRIEGSNYAVALSLQETPQETGDRDAIGSAKLIREYLLTYDDPLKAMNQLAPHFGIPLALRHEKDLHLENSQIALLHQGHTTRVLQGKYGQLIYALLGRDDWVIVAGPFDDEGLNNHALLASALIPAILLAMSAFFWLRPMWRDLRKLNSSAAAFGRGDLSVRSTLSKHSALRLLGTTFNRMAESIQRLIVEQKELTHAVSHEFKTPVARVRFAVEMLRDEKTVIERQRFLQGIERDLDELENLIGELLNHAKYDQSDIALKSNYINLVDWIKRIVGDHQRGKPDIEISIDTSAVTSQVVMDEKAMGKLLNNLLTNALRYARSQIKVTAFADASQAMLCIEDDGPGIPQSECEAVFRPFYRIESSRDRKEGGSGLGLAIVQRIAERHSGRVTCDRSTSLGGAHFCVIWPQNIQ